jgi:hypothetical protein
MLFTPVAGAKAAPRFDFRRDTFAFANDTLREYIIDVHGRLTSRTRETPPEYSRRCFILCRSTLQFYKFAHFVPDRPRLNEEQYRRLIRNLSKIPVWFPAGKWVELPGYADLRSFSDTHRRILQDELGIWWASYFRVGNWRMALPFPRVWQEKLASQVAQEIDEHRLQSLFLTRFRPLNHCVIAFGYEKLADGNIDFIVYDPNDVQKPRRLTYERATRSFYLGKTQYYGGGRVNVFRAYLSPWQ